MPTTVRQLREEHDDKKDQQVALYNPDSEDFTVNYAGQPHTIHSREIERFPHTIAQHLKKHLADHLLNKLSVKTNYEDDRKKVLAQIEVDLDV